MEELEEFWTLNNCEYTYSSVSKYLLIFYISHVFITAIIFVAGLVRRELWLLLLSLGMTLVYWLGSFLQWAFMQAVPLASCSAHTGYCVDRTSEYNACGVAPFPPTPPPGATCGALPLPPCDPCVSCGMPALEPMIAAYTVASIIMFSFQFQPWLRERPYRALVLLAFIALVVYTHLFFGFNDVAQVFVGIVVGSSFSVLYHLLVFVSIAACDRVLEWPLVRYFEYKDTLTR